VTSLGGPQSAGQAMGLNVFLLFTGLGLGSVVFGALLRLGFTPALLTFAAGEIALAVAGLALFQHERPNRGAPERGVTSATH
jgi:predicted MFS family arabinose efflux permease